MSKFDYKAKGELNSQYLLELLQEYLDKIKLANDTKGIEEDDFKISTKSNRFVRWFKDKTTRFTLKWKSETLKENYNNLISTKYADVVKEKLDIYLQTNVLDAKQIFDLQQILKAINFDVVIPEIDEQRYKAIRKSQKNLLKALNDIKYLWDADIDYILYNSPVDELKPFLSDKVSLHKASYTEIQKLLKKYVNVRYKELTTFNFEEKQVEFNAKPEDFYNEKITDNGVGEDVEDFIRSKMDEKVKILAKEEILIEDRQAKISNIDNTLKRLKVLKIEQMLQKLIQLKTNKAYAKEVMDDCKEIINSSTIPNKAGIFLVMDNLYYALSKKCENLQQKAKLKLQLVDKQKLFTMIERMQLEQEKVDETDNNIILNIPKRNSSSENKDGSKNNEQNFVPNQLKEWAGAKKGIATNLYDDEDPEEIDITEDDGTIAPEDEIVIDENDEQENEDIKIDDVETDEQSKEENEEN